MTGEHAVGRVIARPFEGSPGAFRRREGRHDYSLRAAGPLVPGGAPGRRRAVHGVGKIHDLFAGVGVDVNHAGATNAAGIAATARLLRELESGLIFVNLVETDQVYGHRHDVEGFHRALIEIDAAVAEWLGLLRRRRPADPHRRPRRRPDRPPHRSHARVRARCWPSRRRARPAPRGLLADVGASVLLWIAGRRAPGLPGEPFV